MMSEQDTIDELNWHLFRTISSLENQALDINFWMDALEELLDKDIKPTEEQVKRFDNYFTDIEGLMDYTQDQIKHYKQVRTKFSSKSKTLEPLTHTR